VLSSRPVFFLALWTSLITAPTYAQPLDPFDVPLPTAVENKLFEPSSEFNAQIGFMPLDAFYKAVVLNLSYVDYYESFWGWEYFNLTAAFNNETDLRKQLKDEFNVEEAEFLDFVRYSITTNLIYTPVYNKNLLFNSEVVHGEISFVGGAGVVAFDSADTVAMLGGGLILRFFKSETLSYKLDNRVYYHFASGKSTDFVLTINLGLAYEFDPGGKKSRRQVK
jgi:hypothetical protein